MVTDCFLFNDEFNILDARLNYLSPVVDRFLIVESSYTFTGVTKPLMLRSYLDTHYPSLGTRVFVLENEIYLKGDVTEEQLGVLLPFPSSSRELLRVMNTCTVDQAAWLNDAYQRELLAYLIEKHCNDHDTVIISDVDEIPTIKFVKETNPRDDSIVFACMQQYRYNLHMVDVLPWIGSVATRRSTVLREGVNVIRFFTKRKLSHLRVHIEPTAGWHFTSFGDRESILRKMRSWSHQELNTPLNRVALDFRLKRGFDIFGRGIQAKYINNPQMPSELITNLDKNLIFEYISPSRLDILIDTLISIIDKLYRKIRSFIKESMRAISIK